MKIASIYPSPLDNQIRHDYSASIYDNGKIFAYEDAKLSSLKNDGIALLPERSLFAGLKEMKIDPSEIDLWLLPKPSNNYNYDNLYLFFSFLIKAYKGKKKNFSKWKKKKI